MRKGVGSEEFGGGYTEKGRCFLGCCLLKVRAGDGMVVWRKT